MKLTEIIKKEIEILRIQEKMLSFFDLCEKKSKNDSEEPKRSFITEEKKPLFVKSHKIF